MGWVSGSPSRQLNSRTSGLPSASTISPAYRNPRYGAPSSRMPAMVGSMTRRMILSCRVSSMMEEGEYAPMPPVLGPASPSSLALWSWELASGTAISPSLITMKLVSSPSMKSSITTRCPAAPNLPPAIMPVSARAASARVRATVTPLPAASPSAFTTIGKVRVSR